MSEKMSILFWYGDLPELNTQLEELNQKIDSLDNTIANINTQLEEVKSAKAAVEAQGYTVL